MEKEDLARLQVLTMTDNGTTGTRMERASKCMKTDQNMMEPLSMVSEMVKVCLKREQVSDIVESGRTTEDTGRENKDTLIKVNM